MLFTSSHTFAQNQNISDGIIFEGEPYLAINPFDSKHIIVSWMGYIDLSNRIQIKTQSSFDGGESWSETVSLPHFVEGYTSADPSIDFTASGDAFICYVDFTGILSNPIEGALLVSKTEDGGLSWSTPVEAVNINVDAPRRPIDRPWMIIDRSSGPNNGNIYITTMNASGASLPWHPYVSISRDGGSTFEWKELDGPNWLSGNIISQPMPSPDIGSDGVLHAIYPSYAFLQDLTPKYILASSADGGQSFKYENVFASFATVTGGFDDAKKAQLCRVNPADPQHIILVYLDSSNDELDVYMTETKDAGATWNTPFRLNDDPVGNNRMQDLLWADFDLDGDLVVSWRDRRNGTDSLFNTATEIWATYRNKDSLAFAPNFQITSQSIQHEEILEGSGNDFMSIKMQDDTLHAVWGDPREGTLKIWYQSMTLEGSTVSISELGSHVNPSISIYPNPSTSLLHLKGEDIESVRVYDITGKLLINKALSRPVDTLELNISQQSSGTYIVEVRTSKGLLSKKIIKR